MKKKILFYKYSSVKHQHSKKGKMTIWLKYYTKDKEVDFIVFGTLANSDLYVDDTEHVTDVHNVKIITRRKELIEILSRKPRLFRIHKETHRLIPCDNYERVDLYNR